MLRRQTMQQAADDDGVVSLPGFPIQGEILLQILHQIPSKVLVRWSVVSKEFASMLRRPEVFRHLDLKVGTGYERAKKGGEKSLLDLVKQPRFGRITDLTIPKGTNIGEKTFTKLAGAFMHRALSVRIGYRHALY